MKDVLSATVYPTFLHDSRDFQHNLNMKLQSARSHDIIVQYANPFDGPLF